MDKKTDILSEEIAKLIKNADAVAIFAGAGMGVDSGLEQYRDKDGLWTKSIELNDREVNYYDLMTPVAFKEESDLAWGLIGSLIEKYDRIKPHAGFSILRELLMHKEYFIVTSNIDEHFQKAGFDPLRVFEFHGSIHNTQCLYNVECGVWRTPYINVMPDCVRASPPYPMCPVCNSYSRPNIYLFEDGLFSPEISADQQFRYMEWREYINSDCHNIVALEIGAGETLPTIRRYAERFADEEHPLIRINPSDFHTSKANHISIPLGAKECLVQIRDFIA